MAANLLKIYGARGLRRTVSIPLDLSLHIDDTIVGLTHNYKDKRTQVVYRVSGDIPDFLNPISAASQSFFISEQERRRNTRSVNGKVIEIDTETKRVMVQVGTALIECTSRLILVGIGDSVLVNLPAGNQMDGCIVERL